MRKVQLPGSNLHVSALCLGTADLGSKVDDRTSHAQFDRFLAAGGNFIDTAHCYSAWVPGKLGVSDRLVGELIARVGRETLVIAGKGGHIGFEGYPRPEFFLTPETIENDLIESLDRMKTGYVDLYYLHRDDPRLPVSELISAAGEQVLKGRTRAIGASNWSVSRLAEANAFADKHGLPRFVALQNQWALAEPSWADREAPGVLRVTRRAELEALKKIGVAVIPWGPNANGYFATHGEKGAQTYDSPQSQARLARVEAMAAEKGVRPGSLALAYLLDDRLPVIPILGATRAETLQEAIEALSISLTEQEKAALEAPL